MNTRKTLLSAAIVSCIAFSAHAQQAAQTATDLDTVQVTGIRGSMEKSLDTKREANARVEVVTAEDVGKLPAHNVADTLQRLPGVNISSSSADEGGFDEADRVSLRGTSPSLTQTLINGHTVGSADWFVLSQGNNVGRSVSYSLLPSELVSSVEVNKSSQAKLQGRHHPVPSTSSPASRWNSPSSSLRKAPSAWCVRTRPSPTTRSCRHCSTTRTTKATSA